MADARSNTIACLALKRWSRGAAALEQMFDSKMKTNRSRKP